MEKENVVCAVKNIKHRMNFTPYKLIDTTASWRYKYMPEERKKWIDEKVCATWVERTRNYCMLVVSFFHSISNIARQTNARQNSSNCSELRSAVCAMCMPYWRGRHIYAEGRSLENSPRFCPTHNSPTHFQSHTHIRMRSMLLLRH